MPITQVSRIMHRRGLSTELPLALNEGEIGLTTDTGQVFIGSPNFAPIVNRVDFPFQNIELLTEFSIANLLETSATYTYRYQDPTSIQFPGPGSFRTTPAFTAEGERLLQERLDESVSVKAYGAIGDGIKDDTWAIIRACQDIFSNEALLEGPARTLFFPAGEYIITSTIPLYPFTKWLGEGIGKTKITLTSVISIDSLGTLTVGVDALPSSPTAGDRYIVSGTGNLIDGSFSIAVSDGDQIIATGIDVSVGDPWKLSNEILKAVAETVDGQGNTGLNITDLHTIPQDIEVIGIDFQLSDSVSIDAIGIEGATDIIQLNRSNNVRFAYCRFAGNFECADLENKIEFGGYFDEPGAIDSNFMLHGKFDIDRDGMCVRIDSLSNLTPEIFSRSNYQFIGCEFSNQPYAFYITDSVINVNVTDAKFYENYRSIVLGEGCIPGFAIATGDLTIPSPFVPLTKFGPKNFRVTNSLFENIAGPGFSVYSTNSDNISAYNAYRHYGRGCITTEDLILEPFIAPGVFFYGDPENDLVTTGNASVNDDFDYEPDQDRVAALSVFADQDNRRVFTLSNTNTITGSSLIDHHPKGTQSGAITRGEMEPTVIELENNILAEPQQINKPTGIILELDGEQKADTIIIDYSLRRGFSSRKGQLHICADSSGSDIEWDEHVVEVGNVAIDVDFDVTLAVLSSPELADPLFVRVKYTDNADPVDYGNPGFHESTDKIYLKWAATYWDSSITSYGTTTPAELEPNGLIDIADQAGVLDYGFVTDLLPDQEDFESVDGSPESLTAPNANMTLPMEAPDSPPTVYGTL